MNTPAKPDIEAIFPLSYMQKGLLFHHLSNIWDQGFLNVESRLTGNLDLSRFENAWEKAVERHSILRTTVHWENLEKPVQIVHRKKSMQIDFLDWSSHSPNEQKEKWSTLKTASRASGPDFEQGALLKLYLIKIEESLFYLLWPSHHLLVDGWSSQIVLKDVLSFYEMGSSSTQVNLDILPSQKSYLNWVKNQNRNFAENFWIDSFKGFERATLFDAQVRPSESNRPKVERIRLSKEDTDALKEFGGRLKVTMNTIIQGVWSLLLARYFDTTDTVYGTTVSGRSGDFPNIELLAGMFANIQPVRNLIEDEKPFSDWFQEIQKKQQEARNYEHVGLDEITSFIGWPEARPVFDSLLIFENYPKTDSDNKSIQISNFKSGLTSTHPVTMVVMPGEQIEFALSTMADRIEGHTTTWILKNFEDILKYLIRSRVRTFSDLVAKIPPFSKHSNLVGYGQEAADRKYTAPKNEIELRLVKIWERVFGMNGIGIHDNYFEIGGKSLLASRLFAIINKELDVQLPPTTLLEHPTIKEISEIIIAKGKLSMPNWKNLVPLRARGTKSPLYCIHAGGGHVFFYSRLANYIQGDRPIYALQPSGIFGNENKHQNIEEMAEEYVKEIRMVQPHGPYNIMVYCFSTAVGFEMSNILKKSDEVANVIVMDTMAEQEHLMTISRVKMRVLGFIKRLVKNPIKVFRIMLIDRFNRYIRPFWMYLFASTEEKNTALIGVHLVKIYKKYKWRPYPTKVKLLLTQKADKGFNKEYIRSWKLLALGGVEVMITKGNHRTLFEEPDVRFVSKKIDEAIIE